MGPLEGFCLAAGLGTRMGALSQALPKPALTLQHRTLLQWGFDLLAREDFRYWAANTHFKSDILKTLHLQSELIHEPILMGSAGWFASVAPRVQEALMVWNADAVAHDVPFRELRANHLASGADLTWLLVPHPGGPWTPVWIDEHHRILPTGQAGRGPYHFVGASIWSPRIAQVIPDAPTQLGQILHHLHHRGWVVPAFEWSEIGRPQALVEAARRWAPQHEGRFLSNYVHPTATVEGDFRDCIFGPGAAPPSGHQDRQALWFKDHDRQVRINL